MTDSLRLQERLGMQFRAYCPFCEHEATVLTILENGFLKRALANDEDVEVMHLSKAQQDHRWLLNKYEKQKIYRRL